MKTGVHIHPNSEETKSIKTYCNRNLNFCLHYILNRAPVEQMLYHPHTELPNILILVMQLAKILHRNLMKLASSFAKIKFIQI